MSAREGYICVWLENIIKGFYIGSYFCQYFVVIRFLRGFLYKRYMKFMVCK